MRRIRHLRTTRQIVQPIQTRLLGDRIHAPQQQIHRVRLPTPQTPRQLPTHKACYCAGTQIGLVAHAVQRDVGLDELGELDGVACFAAEGEEVLTIQGAGLVVAGFEDGGAAHGGFGGGDEDEVRACYAEEDFPEGWSEGDLQWTVGDWDLHCGELCGVFRGG